MTEIRFYHVQRDHVVTALPSLLEKAMSKGMKILIKTINDERCRYYDDFLWRYEQSSFLPHGLCTDPMPEQQPILITAKDRAHNDASLLITLDGAQLPDLAKTSYKMACFLFDNENQEVLEKIRAQWLAFRNNIEFQVTYWRQEHDGAWKKQER